MAEKKRNINFDITKNIAIMLVMFMHTVAVFLEQFKPGSLEFTVGNILDSITRCAVGLFVMVSGALMLDEEKDISIKYIIKNIVTIMLIFIFWSLIYTILANVIVPIMNGTNIEWYIVIFKFFTGEFHMWYLWMLVGLYIVTPFLRLFVKKENSKYIFSFIIIALFFNFLTPIFKTLVNYFPLLEVKIYALDKMFLGFFSGFIIYYLAGWYLTNIGLKYKKTTYILGLISLICIILLVHFTGDYTNIYNELNMFVFLYTISIFMLINSKSKEYNPKMNNFIVRFSKLTFGIYIIHPIFLFILRTYYLYTNNIILHILVSYTSLVILSVLITYLISKIPYVKKIIRL